MKKEYLKPGIEYIDFELDEEIALYEGEEGISTEDEWID